ncbi:MerR family transcriptional regulator [Pengzhenrongella frigida]|nr:MerR family transcriptional regulator [Cellulomonas sp. HLT2-17]
MRGMLPIGDFSRVSRLSVRTLRRYHDQGLLVPAVVDATTNRRYYSATQAADAHAIRTLRALDVPLEQVRAIVGDGDPAAVRARLVEHRGRLTDELARRQEVLIELDALLDDLGPLTGRTLSIEDKPEMILISTRVRCALPELPAASGAAFTLLRQHVSRNGGALAAPAMTIYHGEGFDPDHVDAELALPVRAWLPVDRSRAVTARLLPPVRAVTTLHQGRYDRIGTAYRAIGQWVEDHHLRLGDDPREAYLVGPDRADPDGWRTEVAWPLG